jgi:hypothetical protein
MFFKKQNKKLIIRKNKMPGKNKLPEIRRNSWKIIFSNVKV